MRIKIKDKVPQDKDIVDALNVYQAEAARNVVNAFNEGYMLGRKIAQAHFGKKGEDE